MIFRRFPYTTLNDLNLDWIIKQVKQIAAALQGKQDKPDAVGVAGQVLGLDENLDPVWLDQSGGGGTTNYNNLSNKPQINSVTLSGNKTAADLGLAASSDIPTGSIALPLMDGTASAGTNLTRFAREGHVHPTDTSRASNSDIAIVQSTNTATQNISVGQYVIWNGALYTASAAIFSGDTLSNSNLTAVTDGGLNDLKNSIVPIDHGGTGQTGVVTYSVASDIFSDDLSSLPISIASVNIAQWGKMVQFRLQATALQDIVPPNSAIATLKPAFRPYMPTALQEITNRNSGYISFSSGQIFLNETMATGTGRGFLATWILS